MPDFEEYAVSKSVDTPYMILWSTIKKSMFTDWSILRIGQYSVSEDPILRIGQYSISKNPIRRIEGSFRKFWDILFVDPIELFNTPYRPIFRVYKYQILNTILGTVFRVPPYPFNYPIRRLTMEEILAKFIDEGKREHDEMEIFIREFRTTNELLLKRPNQLIEGGKMTSEATPSKEINETGINKNEPPRFEQDMQEKPHDVEEACTVTMNERCSAVLLNKLPSKEKDTGSFTIPCQVSHLQINNALADLGASISLMPYTMYENLGLGEPKPTRMSLKLADRSIQYPRGIVENVLIKVDKFVLLIDFVILDMPKDSRISIILGRPFLANARAMIDVFNKKITLRVGDDEVIFDMDQSTKKPPTKDDECHGIDDLDDTVNIETQELLENDQLDPFFT
ncbi:DNA-directed DNA polymerase [Tanacetum coccineum]